MYVWTSTCMYICMYAVCMRYVISLAGLALVVTMPTIRQPSWRLQSARQLVMDCASASAMLAFEMPALCLGPCTAQVALASIRHSLRCCPSLTTTSCTADIAEFVSFGEVGADQVPPGTIVFLLLLTSFYTPFYTGDLEGSTCLQVDAASYYLLVAPQNMVGNTILTGMGEMVSCFTHSVLTCIQGRPAIQAAWLKSMPPSQAANLPRGAGSTVSHLQICSR